MVKVKVRVNQGYLFGAKVLCRATSDDLVIL